METSEEIYRKFENIKYQRGPIVLRPLRPRRLDENHLAPAQTGPIHEGQENG